MYVTLGELGALVSKKGTRLQGFCPNLIENKFPQKSKGFVRYSAITHKKENTGNSFVDIFLTGGHILFTILFWTLRITFFA